MGWDGYMEAPLLPQPLHEVWDDPFPSSIVPLMIGGNKDEGILLLLEFLADRSKLTKLNDEFATEGPALLLGVDPVADPWLRDEGETATAEILRSNYLGGGHRVYQGEPERDDRPLERRAYSWPHRPHCAKAGQDEDPPLLLQLPTSGQLITSFALWH